MASGSSSSKATSVRVAARRDRAAVRGEPLGERGGERGAAREHGVEVGVAQHAERGER